MALLPLVPGSLGPDMVNTDKSGNVLATPLPGLDQVRYRDADFWNKAKNAVVENRAAIIELETSGGGAAISSADGLTSVETEATADTVTVTAGGQAVASMSATKSTTKTPVDGAGMSAAMGVDAALYGGIAPGFFAAAGADGVRPVDGPVPAMLYGYASGDGAGSEGGGVALGASSTGDLGGSRPEAIVSTGASKTLSSADANGTLAATFGAAQASVSASASSTGASSLAFTANGSAPIEVNDPSHVDLPVGITSLVHGITEALSGAGGDPVRVANAAGTTSVDTEATADTVTVTAGGVAAGKFSAIQTLLETAPGAGRNASVLLRGSALYEPLVHLTARESTSPLHLSEVKLERDKATLQTVRVGFSAKSEVHTSESLLRLGYRGNLGGAQILVANGGPVTFQRITSSGSNSGAAIPVDDAAALALPAGHASIVGGLNELAARRPVTWAPTFTGDANVASVTVLNATQRTEGAYVTLSGSLSVTAVAAGPAVVTAALPVTEGGAGAGGRGGCFNASSGAMTLSMPVILDPATLTVGLEASDAGAHIVSFDITYEAA